MADDLLREGSVGLPGRDSAGLRAELGHGDESARERGTGPGDTPTFGVSEFVAVLNQTLEYAYPSVTIVGEIANFRVSKGRWVYFDLKDERASVRFFGTVYQLPGPLEDGLRVVVRGVPKLHPLYGFSVTAQSIRPAGEGSIKKATALLEAKLRAEGLFDAERKRVLPYPPAHVGLITSAESAAYRDFIKVLGARWGGARITLIDVQVQGEPAPSQIVAAITQLNQLAQPPEVLVVTRGGGSAEDLQAFSTESVTRAVSASRVPTIVAIGHEVDVSLAELAADCRASTPSNAAELLVPDRQAMLAQLHVQRERLDTRISHVLHQAHQNMTQARATLHASARHVFERAHRQLELKRQLLQALDPRAPLLRGYALVRSVDAMVRQGSELSAGQHVRLEFADAQAEATITHVTMKPKKGSQ